MRNKTNSIVSIAFVCLVMNGCGSSSSSGGGSAVLSPTINLSMAQTKAMYVAPTGTTASASDYMLKRFADVFVLFKEAYAEITSATSLFALSATGTLTSVSITNGGSPYVQGVIDLPIYTALQTSSVVDSAGNNCGVVLIKKSDSTTYCITSTVNFPSASWGVFTNNIKSNYAGNIVVLLDTSGNVIRINLTDPSNPVETTLMAAPPTFGGQTAMDFAMNGEGDVIVSSAPMNALETDASLDLGVHQNIVQSTSGGVGNLYIECRC